MPASQNLSAPFSFPPSQTWDGNAGSWSTFIVRIGTPPQDFKVLPSTSGHQTWIPVPLGCSSRDPPNCGALRGALPFNGVSSNGFLSNQSSTWIKNGIYDLGIETHNNLTGNGDYGYDTVGLGNETSGGPQLSNQVVAGIATKDFYLGQFGLGHKPSNFTTYDDPIPSFLKNLADSQQIPSLSYAYTAGAKYRLDGVFASLTFGGYDASRSAPSNFTIPFSLDDSRSLTAGVQSISAMNTLKGSVELLSAGAFYLIDSSIQDLWLPEVACDYFEEAFGLIFDDSTNLYTVNDTIHSRLLELNPSVTIKIGIQPVHGRTVDISLPYGAFDLQASSPIYPNVTNYFPLRRATNDTQYVLGRTFLQEAHIIVDYERSNFSVNQVIHKSPNPEDIITIQPITNDPAEATTHHHGLGRGDIAGIVVGAVSGLFFILALSFFGFRKYRSAKHAARSAQPVELDNPEMQDANHTHPGSPRPWMLELDNKAEVLRTPQELSPETASVLTRPRYELRGSSTWSELPSPLPSPMTTEPTTSAT